MKPSELFRRRRVVRQLVSSGLLTAVLWLWPVSVPADVAVTAWVQRCDGPGYQDDFPYALAVDRGGSVIVTGFGTALNGEADYLTIKYSSAGSLMWMNTYDGPAEGWDSAVALAVDTNDNVIVTGYSYGIDSDADWATIKYSGEGVPLWTNRYNGTANGPDLSHALAVDANGNVFVSGTSFTTNGYEWIVLAYSGDGMPLWTNRYQGSPSTRAGDVAVDADGDVIVTGDLMPTGSQRDWLTIKYSNAGVPLWTNRYAGPQNGNDMPSSVAVDAGGNVIVAGQAMFDGYEDCVIIKYSGAGVPLWTNRYSGPRRDFPTDVTVDSGGNVIVVGQSDGAGIYPDYLTVKYSSAGVRLWTRLYNGPTHGEDAACAVAVDANDTIIVTGRSFNSASDDDIVTIAYSSTGSRMWTNYYNGPGNGIDDASAMAVDANGNVYVTGLSRGSRGDFDFATIKYVTPLVITNTTLVEANLILRGTGGCFGASYYVLASTNVAEAIDSWVCVATNTFGAGGTFCVTNALDPVHPQQFFRLKKN